MYVMYCTYYIMVVTNFIVMFTIRIKQYGIHHVHGDYRMNFSYKEDGYIQYCISCTSVVYHVFMHGHNIHPIRVRGS